MYVDVANSETELESKISYTQNIMNWFQMSCTQCQNDISLKLNIHLFPGQFLILEKQLNSIQ